MANELTDIEITRLCAEAMGYFCEPWSHVNAPPTGVAAQIRDGGTYFNFDPLHDDAQCMALVKKFRVHIDTYSGGDWLARCLSSPGLDLLGKVRDVDLNRAICLCVARMQQEKSNG